MTEVESRLFWTAIRMALLGAVDAIERYKLKLKRRTSELRKDGRNRE